MRRTLTRFALTVALMTGAAAPALSQPKLETAVFAGGCFWSMQHDMAPIRGVVSTEVGYEGGHVDHPTYEQVSSETTGHLESVKVTFDPAKVSYAALVEHYWRLIDPTDDGGAFCDRGPSYHSAIFVTSDQRHAAEASLAALNKDKRFAGHIVTQIRPATTFWPAEGYHQHYADKNPVNYFRYRVGCGKDGRVKQLWGAEAFK
ncbi:peptide-methionine (S)-S-oxide reductase MsrA [Phenylobacterium montanum]|uniref:Peptide methionine sulfoxide reductase MsrA n=1 Tax=Phenylobacterium montanum TaxID=2823693 RepID=A0A975FXA5_9CAUL|nr:peptide-methionine (S)-S-oxide reductase MsrA [Caulobacter sp. S6]QUD86006.1 peptide-methionine (S)-S-oxide reductase MsrA [Caulobacter sp. S6]